MFNDRSNCSTSIFLLITRVVVLIIELKNIPCYFIILALTKSAAQIGKKK